MTKLNSYGELARRNIEMTDLEKLAIDASLAGGAMTARQRMELLFDEGTFQEIDRFVTHRCTDFGMDKKRVSGDAVISGNGMINGRLVHAYAQDFKVLGGSFSIPQISAIMGPCAGGASYSPALTDFIIMVEKQSHMFVTGPEVIKAVTHEDVSMEELGGARSHNQLSGVSHLLAANDKECIVLIRELLDYMPANNLEESPVKKCFDDPRRREPLLNDFIPADSRTSYDVKALLRAVVDDSSFFEVQGGYAPNLVIGFARLNGKSVGIVANQPAYLAGALDTSASRKGARFVRFCDAFNIPLVTFVDVPGFLPGKEQELDGIIRDGAKLLFAYCEATVPKISLITRKAYGGAYCVMSSKHIRGDYNFAYPGAEIAVMGPEAAVNIIYRRELAKQQDETWRLQKLDEYRERFANPYVAASRGYIDEIIMPEDTRWKLIMALERLKTKMIKNPPKKHGNMPL